MHDPAQTGFHRRGGRLAGGEMEGSEADASLERRAKIACTNLSGPEGCYFR